MDDVTIPDEPQEEPAVVGAETWWFAITVIVIALGLSITTNTYNDLHVKSSVPWGIPLAFGIFIPVLVAFISHTAATLGVHWSVRALIALPAGAFMAVSAHAGIDTLSGPLGFGWAVTVAVTVDGTAMVFLGILMYAAELSARHARWQRAERRRLQRAEAEAETRRKRAEIEVLAARQSGGNTPGNAASNGAGLPAGNGTGNAPGSAAGNGHALLAIGAAQGAADAGGEEAPGDGAPGSVTPFRRPAASDEEMRLLAEDLAAELEADGKRLSVRAYMARYGGSPNRVSPIVNQVNDPARVAARAAERESPLAAAGEGS